MTNHIQILSKEFNLNALHIENVINLIDEGNTIPFIARYRKEMTGAMDDQVLREVADRLNYLRNLDKRKEEVLTSIENQGKLTDELREAVEACLTLAQVEDVYRPYKQKKRTRATIAREKGLEPLAALIFAQEFDGDLNAEAEKFIDEEKGVDSIESALAGASDIIAEDISDSADIRTELKESINKFASLSTLANTEEDTVYSMYYEYSEPVDKIPSHRILAINRGENEGMLKVTLDYSIEKALDIIEKEVIIKNSTTADFLKNTIEDSYSRLIFPSVEREIRNQLTDMANEQAIRNFSINLKPLLMQAPLKNNVVMGFDPAYRTGCKIAVVDPTGKVLDTTVVYPTPPHNRTDEAKLKLSAMIRKHGVNVISIGNGTASKESEIFVADMIKDFPGVKYMVVSEAGASVYSASKLGAEEFPDFDVALRSAVSIARRLQDPLAELVKIDPKAIGVGQYQHDMPQARLGEALAGVVEDCVNSVGVDLNTASPSLLSYVSGISSSVSQNIVTYREENGSFTKRSQLLKVPKLGPKTYEQCAGFLRVPGGENILDNTGVHPESYAAAESLLAETDYTLDDVKNGKVLDIYYRTKQIGERELSEKIGVGIPTIRDIVTELMKPGLDPRDELPKPMLRSDVMGMEDLKEGMILKGTVRNVIDFGVFVDIGVHQDGLVHISQISDRRINHPSDVLKVGQIIKVQVLSVDLKKKRIGLTMKIKNDNA
ncbi:MAG TPA: RNA-binding transcriptional accessory protein [Clostridiales bacterium]|nr:RNA-binding transcriptional accessory protein [Clostridiales bacterium]